MKKEYLQVGLVSFIILFLELLLIRYLGTEIRIFAYFSNLVLLAIFIGAGSGMLIRRKLSFLVSSAFLCLLLLVINLEAFKSITELLAPINENFIWFQAQGGSYSGVNLGLIMSLAIFFVLMMIFAPLGQYLGGIFEKSDETVLLYSIDIGASIAGMWAFYGISILNFSPLTGIIIAQIMLLLLNSDKKVKLFLSLFIPLTVTMSLFVPKSSDEPFRRVVWSPYQKLVLTEAERKSVFNPSGYLLTVNNAIYMFISDLSNEFKSSALKKADLKNLPGGYDSNFSDPYLVPYLLKPDVESVLIAGAGGGNDVAAALRSGVRSIDAVEIDPAIIEIGREYHPEKPYLSARVNIINDDARAVFQRSDKKYDLVIIGAADSHTLSSSLTNLRLDHYLYTKESFGDIKRILKPDGMLFIAFEVKREWIGARIKKSIAEAFGYQPLVLHLFYDYSFAWGSKAFIATPDKEKLIKYINYDKKLKDSISRRAMYFNEDIEPLTDDWPYLYLDQPRIPQIHLWMLALLALVLLPLGQRVRFKGTFRWDMFFMGAGFLLYEFQNITKTALLFGNTWTTNLFTITSVLLFILLANFTQARRPININLAFGLLFGTIVAQIFVPLEALNSLSYNSRIIWGSLFLNLPFFFSGLIFIDLFKNSREKSSAFASNLVGAAVGGALETLSFLTGIRALLFVGLVLYLISFLAVRMCKKSP